MLVRVYTFERDAQADTLPADARVSTAAIGALIAAINERFGIQFEELTEPDNHRPVIAVLFAGPVCRHHFDGLIEATLKLSGVRICSTQEMEAHPTTHPAAVHANTSPANDSPDGDASRAA